MVLPGHLAGGYLATKAILSLSHVAFSSVQMRVLYAIGIAAGEAPDIDLVWFFFEHRSSKQNKKEHHRSYPTHAPVLWLAASLVIMVVGYFLGSVFTEYIGAVILGGSFSHFLLDSIEHGVMWLWPLSNRFFCLKKLKEPVIDKKPGGLPFYYELVTKHYIKDPTFYIEMAITLVAIFIALK